MRSFTTLAAHFCGVTTARSVKPTLHLHNLKSITIRRGPLASRSIGHKMAATDGVSSVSSIPPVKMEDENEKFGFKRAEMYESSLANTMGDPYDRHVFLCYKNHNSWVARLEVSEDDPLTKLFCSTYMSRRNQMPIQTRVTICEGGKGTEFQDGDALIFPDMVKYKGLTESNVESFVDEVLVNGKPWSYGVPTSLKGSHVFVCAHGNRDKRCGVCGPVLIEEFKKGVDSRGLQNKVVVSACSHIGGHKYAGNLIVFNPDDQGKIMGHWYGYVTPKDVPDILDKHIGKGFVLQKLLRGQMGVHPEDSATKVADTTVHIQKAANVASKLEENASDTSKDTFSGCCQGANGFSCCRDASSDATIDKEKRLGSNWFASVENIHLYAAVAVAGAVAAVAVAHVLYKRSH